MSKSQQGRENKVPKRVTKNESPAGSGRAPVREQVGPGMEPEDAQALKFFFVSDIIYFFINFNNYKITDLFNDKTT